MKLVPLGGTLILVKCLSRMQKGNFPRLQMRSTGLPLECLYKASHSSPRCFWRERAQGWPGRRKGEMSGKMTKWLCSHGQQDVPCPVRSRALRLGRGWHSREERPLPKMHMAEEALPISLPSPSFWLCRLCRAPCARR